ncbi:GILT-like protein 1 [Nilaparvata lugens]|uniref:Seminal fluid protein n=1 Tax=Nilaparvata lugens TaxID=108931 RepID=A0A1I9WL41_NILLU|nr:GILT-like protein 1 [Nilaparvata lugens]APA33861.1 seminal fluid protein [Nilaparvata lugens]
MARIIAVLAGFMAFMAFARAEDMKKVPITVYYESLCPDSMKFFVDQLYPTWTSLSQYMDLTLVPYGRANYSMAEDGSGKYMFECRHGEHECEGDRIHICAINKMPMQDYMKLIKCTMSMSMTANNSSAYPGKQCAASVGITDYSPIEKCVTDMAESDKLFVAMGNKTMELKPKLESVPAITFKDEYKPSEQAKYRSDLKMAVCSMIMGEKPEACKAGPKGSAGNLVPEFAVYASLAVISTIFARM